MIAPADDWPDLPDPYRRLSPEQRARRTLTAELVTENIELLRAWTVNVNATQYNYSRPPTKCPDDCACGCHTQARLRRRSR